MDNTSLLRFYKDQVQNDLLPFWHNVVDQKNGGIYTCLNNTGEKLVSKDKYTWSQGRFLWLWSKIIQMIEQNKLDGTTDRYHNQLSKTAQFLEENVFLDNGNCAFLMSETGKKKESIDAKGYDSSIYADCFVVLGMAAYARTVYDINRFEGALELYDRIRERINNANIRTEPYPIPEGYKAHAVPMIMINTTQEVANAAETLDHHRSAELYEYSVEYMKEIMELFRQQDGRIVEMLPSDSSQEDTLLYRHVNPGHSIECMWFVMDTAQRCGCSDYVGEAIQTIKQAIETGWDKKYGGLLRFVDADGGKPKGKQQKTSYEKMVTNSWDMKLWWPHSEVLYATLRSYTLSGDEKMLELYKKVEAYVFDTFPNPNRDIGEWIQIRNRKGAPVEKVAALPVKDPFHILRNMLLIIDLLEDTKATY